MKIDVAKQKNLIANFHSSMIFISLFITLTHTACAGEWRKPNQRERVAPPPQQEETIWKPEVQWPLIDFQYDQNLASSLIKESLNEISEENSCFMDEANWEKECFFDVTKVRFSDGKFAMDHHTTESVLMVEEEVDEFLATTRYRHRIRSFYTIKNGRVVAHNPEFKIPTVLNNIFKRFSEFSRIPAHALESLDEAISETYPHLSYLHGVHNTTILGMALEYNPESPFVLLQRIPAPEDIFAKDILCARGMSSRKKAHFTERARSLSEDLRKLIKQEDIHYISMSFGISEKSIKANLRKHCPQLDSHSMQETSHEVVKALAPVFRVLSNSPEVLTVQSSPYGYSDNGPYDCEASFPNRIMAGAFNDINAPLNEEGAFIGKKQQYLKWIQSLHESKSGLCPDIYVNFNMDFSSSREKPYTLMAPLSVGFGMGHLGRRTAVSTSNAAPLVLAMVIHKRHQDIFYHRNFDQKLVEDIIADLIPQNCGLNGNESCSLQDPLRHRQTMIHARKLW